MKGKESILVVDDDLDFLKIIKRILENKNYEVDTAPSANEGTCRLKERFYNAAILDISLPDADGTELLSRCLDIHPDIVAIMLTGHSSVQNAVQSLNRGAFAYLEKPLDTETLLSVINRGLEKQRLVLENRSLMEELEQRNRITNTLLSVSQAVSESLDLQQIVDSSLEKVAYYTGIKASFIYLYENDRLVLKGTHGLSPRQSAQMAKEIQKDSGIIWRIFRQAKPIIIDDFTNLTDKNLEPLKKKTRQSFGGIPLSILGESIGVMGVVTSDTNHEMTDNNIELLTGIGREITIAVRNAQLYEAASSAKALQELDNMRTEFLANVSHELRTPLAVIKGSANSLLQSDVIFDESTRQYFLQSIDKDADTLTRLVDDLLMMSRLEAEALEVKRKLCKLSEVIETIQDRLDNLTVKHQLQVNIPDDLPSVNIDDIRIGQVLTNLVENAVKFSDDNTNIRIEAESNDKDIIVSVTDQGSGIPPEIHEKIFERFFQGNGSKAGRRKGTGLGLAICRGIIEAHGGKIWVESQPDQGARFTFSLPLN
ncbi:MAG TPA: response regulator [Dehalococcoidia bacterium]|nr:response regulator [Dehalococcoidia bacterium]